MTASWQSKMRTAPAALTSASRSSTVVLVAHSTEASPARGGAPGGGASTARASQSRAAGSAMDFCTPPAKAGATSDSRVL
jgi:hypothetical protein